MTVRAVTRLVIHRRRHPSGYRRWFRHRDRDYGLLYMGPGWGYEIVDLESDRTVGDGYFTFDDVRRVAPGDIDAWVESLDDGQ